MYLNIISWISWRIADPLLLICAIHNWVLLNLGICINFRLSKSIPVMVIRFYEYDNNIIMATIATHAFSYIELKNSQ